MQNDIIRQPKNLPSVQPDTPDKKLAVDQDDLLFDEQILIDNDHTDNLKPRQTVVRRPKKKISAIVAVVSIVAVGSAAFFGYSSFGKKATGQESHQNQGVLGEQNPAQNNSTNSSSQDKNVKAPALLAP